MTHGWTPHVRQALSCLALAASVACVGGSPDRLDPLEFPGALSDTAVVPPTNNCLDRAWGFEVEGRGWVDATWSGIGQYAFQSTPSPITQITLRSCDGGIIPQVFTLSYVGTTKVEPGEHVVSRTASTDAPGFFFSFTDTTREGAESRRCDDQPIGRVFIDAIDARRIRGRLDIQAGCVDAETISTAVLPQETWFRGWFEAENVGSE